MKLSIYTLNSTSLRGCILYQAAVRLQASTSSSKNHELYSLSKTIGIGPLLMFNMTKQIQENVTYDQNWFAMLLWCKWIEIRLISWCISKVVKIYRVLHHHIQLAIQVIILDVILFTPIISLDFPPQHYITALFILNLTCVHDIVIISANWNHQNY